MKFVGQFYHINMLLCRCLHAKEYVVVFPYELQCQLPQTEWFSKYESKWSQGR